MKTSPNTWVKISTQNHFTLYQDKMNPTHFQARLKGSGNYLRRRFQAPDLESALREAPRVIGLVSEAPKHEITLFDAFEMALEATNRRERSRQDWIRTTEKFLLWLKKNHPLCTTWDQMTRQIVRGYLSTFAGKSANYRRLALQPLLQTSGFMHREYGFPNIGERMGIGTKLQKTPPVVYLEDVVSFCDFVREHRPHLEAGVCLQGLAGLQLLEALRLTWDKVDLDRGLIEISGEVKNEYRNRVIPVCNRVLGALKRAKTLGDVRIRGNTPVVRGVQGLGFLDDNSYARQVRAQFKSFNPDLNWSPKDLRNCLPTFAMMQGIHGTIWEQYIGHAPKGVTNRHYIPRLSAPSQGGFKALEQQMNLFRLHVTEPVERASCNFLQLGDFEETQDAS
ncbi:MAG: site-specific integrase [Candidatus Sumerlaeia bacterium]|nr:site-specific integrase [Candidatus Sumerlaeia bacterium]